MTPQTILILLCAAAAVLLLIRLSIGGSGRRLRSPDVGSSMTIGGREVQEDFVGTLATQAGLVAVLADGMGKAYGARIASRTAVETFLDLFRDYNAFDNPQYYFRKSFHAANRAILRELGDEGYGAASVGAAMIRENWLFTPLWEMSSCACSETATWYRYPQATPWMCWRNSRSGPAGSPGRTRW